MRAYVESVRYYKTHRDEAVKKIIFLSKLPDRQMGEVIYDGSLRATPDDGKPTLKADGSGARCRCQGKFQSQGIDGSTTDRFAVHTLRFSRRGKTG